MTIICTQESVFVFLFPMFKIPSKIYKKIVPYLSKEKYLLKNATHSRKLSLAEKQLVLFVHDSLIIYLDFQEQIGERPPPRESNRTCWHSSMPKSHEMHKDE